MCLLLFFLFFFFIYVNVAKEKRFSSSTSKYTGDKHAECYVIKYTKDREDVNVSIVTSPRTV